MWRVLKSPCYANLYAFTADVCSSYTKSISQKQYKIHFARAQQFRKEVEAKTQTIDAMKDKLLARFQEWHEDMKRDKPRSVSAQFDSQQTVEEDLESLDEGDGAGMAYESRPPSDVAAYAYDDEIEEEEDHEDEEDALDEGEKFEKMEMDRVLAHNPDSVAFFQVIFYVLTICCHTGRVSE